VKEKYLRPFREMERRIEIFSIRKTEMIALQFGPHRLHLETARQREAGNRAPANTGSAVAYIVLLEDYKEVSEVMCHALRSEGHQCFVIRSRRVAERFLSRVRPDLVLRFSHLNQLICVRIAGPAVSSRSKVKHLTDSEH
jgi:hypothetical protein